ncbi:hypothetical protein F5Y08DRAFT_343067 [Xylaria arbuscula]|nr:hypothetical protein F5Y08DRAFT_343067 [Xylaria arbuscula]
MAHDEVEKLKEELAILRTYQAVAEHNLQQVGLNLKAAQKQGWVSKRAEARRKRVEKKKAAEDAKWAEIERDGQWIRNERKKVELPVDDPTPSPSEAAYRERVYNTAIKAKERSLRNRVRRVSEQLLIAAALGKQYRELTTADHTGHNVPGTDPAIPLEHIPFDARSETNLSATEAMARSFRNWAHREKQNRSRSRSQTPSTVYASSRTTGPDTTVSGSASDSSLTDDDDTGVVAAMALIYDADFWGKDDAVDGDDEEGHDDDDDDDDDYSDGIAGLSFNDVSEETKLAVCAMMATASTTKTEVMDWADILATTVSKALFYLPPPSPEVPRLSDLGTVDQTDDDVADDGDPSDDLEAQMEELFGSIHFSPPQKNSETKPKKSSPETVESPQESQKNRQSKSKSKSPLPAEVKAPEKGSSEHESEADEIAPSAPVPVKDIPSKAPKKKPTPKNAAPSVQTVPKRTLAPPLLKPQVIRLQHGQRQKPQGYRPPPPDQTVWDPSLWHVNKTDYDDGVWAGKDPRFVQPKSKMETGWITWAEQERRFPRLDERLRMHSVRKQNPMIYDPSTVDTQIWDPLTRAIAEARTGKREPLHLNPVTIHSLARWAEAGYGVEYSLDPLPHPSGPSAPNRKRPLPSTSYTSAAAKKRKTTTMAAGGGGGGGLFGTYMGKGKKKTNNNRVSFAPSAVSVPGPGAASANQAVASIHYPLKSPAAQSFSKAGVPDTPGSEQSGGHGYGYSAIAGLKSARSWSTTAQAPLTPAHARSTGATTPATPTVSLFGGPEDDTAERSGGGGISSGDRQRLTAFLDKIRSRGAQQGKRAATEEPSSSATKKRRTAEEDEEESVYPATPSSLKTPKSVRFDVQKSESGGGAGSGPSYGMRDGARRALGRYGRTSSRRGPLPVR